MMPYPLSKLQGPLRTWADRDPLTIALFKHEIAWGDLEAAEEEQALQNIRAAQAVKAAEAGEALTPSP